MPQMAPLWWELLFIMFIMTYIIMSMMIYHTPNMNLSHETKTNQMSLNMIWKW
uniref:ATP synthase F0 subunit 8 n=1 Tax=Coleoptera sp. 3 KM-2017 TaxID=2219334 RepID=A0A346RHZ6_9COLE|nr:ATP synthase F0 subunit 8 [Coleoptera sp. 3 KM-2017]